MKNIYKILNDVNIDFSDIEDMEVNDFERKKGKKKLLNSISKKKKNRRIVAAASMFVFIAASTVVISNPTLAANIPIVGELMQKNFVDINKNYEDYLNVIGKTQNIDGVEVTFENVIADKNLFFVSFLIKDNNSAIDDNRGIFGPMNIKINGKLINTSGGGQSEKVDNNTVRVLRTFNWNYERLPEKLNVELEMSLPNLINSEKEFKAKFSMDTKQIEEKTYTKKINKDFILNGIKCRIEEITISPLVTNIKYYAETEDDKFEVDFLIYDQDGKEIRFFGGESTVKGCEEYREGKIDYNMRYINTGNIEEIKIVPKYWRKDNNEDPIIDESQAFIIKK